MTRVGPINDGYQLHVTDLDDSDWGNKALSGYQNSQNNGNQIRKTNRGYTGTQNTEESTVRRRRRRSFEPGSDYASYVEKRVFNKIHAWTPYLWERKRFVSVSVIKANYYNCFIPILHIEVYNHFLFDCICL